MNGNGRWLMGSRKVRVALAFFSVCMAVATASHIMRLLGAQNGASFQEWASFVNWLVGPLFAVLGLGLTLEHFAKRNGAPPQMPPQG